MELKDNIIFLPTRGRIEKQITLGMLPNVILKNLVIACPPEEKTQFQKLWGDRVRAILPIKANNIGEVRQYCIEWSPTDYITFVDDSLNFHMRGESEKGIDTVYPLKTLTKKHYTDKTLERHIFDMFNWIVTQLKTDSYGLVGISRRSSNAHNLESDIQYNERVCSFWGINRKLYNSLPGKPKFSDFPIKEDFYITLHFLTNGIPTVTSYLYSYGRVGGSNSPGGCSIYRNMESSNKISLLLKEKFPRFVSLRMKKTKSWGGDFTDKCIDISIQSAKAYKYGKNKDKQIHGLLFP